MPELTSNIPEYGQKKEDLLDVYNYLLDNTEMYDDMDEFNWEDFNVVLKESPIDVILEEVEELKDSFGEFSSFSERVEKIESQLSLEYPVYIFKGEIIAGMHRAVAYVNKNVPVIPIVYVSVKKKNKSE